MKTEWLLNYVIHYVYPEYYLRVTMCSIKPASVLETLPASAMENVTRFLTPQDLAGLRVLSKKTREVVDDTSHGAFLVYARKMYADSVEKIHDAGLFYARVNILEWLWKTHGDLFFSTRVCAVAASFGRTDVLSWLRDHGCPWDQSTCAESARKGHLETLMWVRERGCPWDGNVLYEAARATSSCHQKIQSHRDRHEELLAWVSENGCPLDKSLMTDIVMATIDGDLATLMMLHRHECCPLHADICFYAAKYGHKNILYWAKKQGFQCDERACRVAAETGRFEILKWLRKNGCAWDAMTCAVAAKNGHLGILDWLRKQDPPAPWTHLTFSWAAWGGQVEVMRWLENNNCPRSYKLQEYAQDSGSISAIKWVEENITAKLTFEPDTNLVGKK